MRTGVEKGARRALAVAHQDDRAPADIAGGEISRFGDLRLMAGIEPRAIEDLAPLVFEEFRIGPAAPAEARRRRLACAVGLCLDPARRHAVDGDAVTDGLPGQSDRQPDHRALADPGEERVVGRAGTPRLAANIDDPSVAA